MGRQTQVAMTDVDEHQFLTFLRGIAPIQHQVSLAAGWR